MTVPAAKDLVTILYKPRETFRRILDSGAARWTVELVVLAYICTSVGDPDFRGIEDVLPGFPLHATLAAAALLIILGAIVWTCVVYVFSWMTTFAGRFLGSNAPNRDVHAAIAWSLVPVVWSVLYRIPFAIYRNRFDLERLSDSSKILVLGDFVQQGGCSIAVLAIALQFLLYAAVIWVAGNCVAEALGFSAWKALGTLAIAASAPLVIIIAALLATHT